MQRVLVSLVGQPDIQTLVMLMDHRHQEVMACKGYATKYNKSMMTLICPIIFEPLKLGALRKQRVSSSCIVHLIRM